MTAEGDYLVADVFNNRIRLVDAAEPLPAPPPVPPTPPPAATPPPPTERNLTAPQVSFSGRVAGRAQYACSTGTWEGLAAAPGFQFTWWQVNDLIRFDAVLGSPVP